MFFLPNYGESVIVFLNSEDIAFLIIGGVGLTMSFFTKSIGRNIIKAVEKDGEETRKEIGDKLDTLNGKLDTMGNTLGIKLDTVSDKLDALVTILDKRLPKPQ